MKINEKVVKKFIESTIKLQIANLSYIVISEMINDNYVARHSLEKDAKRVIDTILYMQNNLGQIFGKNFIEIIYFLISSKKISDDNLNEILCCYYMNYNEDIYKQAVLMNIKIQKMKIFKKNELAFMMANFILILNKACPIIIYNHEIKDFYKFNSLKNKYENTLEYWHKISTRGELFHKYDRSNITLIRDIDEITRQILLEKDLFTEALMIKNMFIFGSTTRNATTAYSDIDVIIVFKEELEIYKKNKFLNEIKSNLKRILETSVDICEFSEIVKFTDDLRKII